MAAPAVGNAAAKGSEFFDKKGQTQPVVGTLGKQITQSVEGGSQLTQGIATGNKRLLKEGAKNVGESALSTLTDVGGLNSLNEPPAAVTVDRSQYGGSQDAADAIRSRNAAGMSAGNTITNAGVGVLGQAANQAGRNNDLGTNIAGTGTRLGAAGVGNQNSALGASLRAANQDVGSVAAAQQQIATDKQAQQMMAQAASARGGSQAAAIQGAQAQAAANGLATSQQLGLLRLQEAENRRAGVVQAQQNAANQYGNQAALGYNTALGGVGAANTSTGQLGQIGGTVAGVGTTTTGQYLNADTNQNASQLAADSAAAQAQAKLDWERNQAAQAAKGGVIGLAGKALGSFL